MKRQCGCWLVLLMTIAVSVPSYADSDGYYCAAKGYLVYELRAGITPGTTGHVIKVVRFDSIRSVGSITVQDFQVHKLNCVDDRIEIAGFGSAPPGTEAPLTTCVIEIVTVSSAPDCREETASMTWRTWPEPGNLGQWARHQSIALVSPDPDYRYRLRLETLKQTLSENAYKIHYKTELIQTDSKGRESQRFLIYDASIEASDGD